jgi:hypothetical protein
MSDNKEYSEQEIDILVDELKNKYNNDFKHVSIKCKVKDKKYYYTFDSIPIHKCVAKKILLEINPRSRRAYKNLNFKNAKFN